MKKHGDIGRGERMKEHSEGDGERMKEHSEGERMKEHSEGDGERMKEHSEGGGERMKDELLQTTHRSVVAGRLALPCGSFPSCNTTEHCLYTH